MNEREKLRRGGTSWSSIQISIAFRRRACGKAGIRCRLIDCEQRVCRFRAAKSWRARRGAAGLTSTFGHCPGNARSSALLDAAGGHPVPRSDDVRRFRGPSRAVRAARPPLRDTGHRDDRFPPRGGKSSGNTHGRGWTPWCGLSISHTLSATRRDSNGSAARSRSVIARATMNRVAALHLHNGRRGPEIMAKAWLWIPSTRRHAVSRDQRSPLAARTPKERYPGVHQSAAPSRRISTPH